MWCLLYQDYSLRAKDYNKKKAQLKSLRQKAADRNEDEFYFGMMSRKGPGSRTRDGKNWKGTVAGDRGNKILDMDTVRLLKTQDMGYVRTMKQIVSKDIARLDAEMALKGGLQVENDNGPVNGKGRPGASGTSTVPKKIVFCDDKGERDQEVKKATQQTASHSDKAGGAQVGRAEELARTKSLDKLKQRLELSRRKRRVLSRAEANLEIQRAKMAKTATSGGRTRKGKDIKVRTRKR